MCWGKASIGERARGGIVAVSAWLRAIKNGDRFPIERRFDFFVRTGIEVAVAFSVLRPVELGENRGRRCKAKQLATDRLRIKSRRRAHHRSKEVHSPSN